MLIFTFSFLFSPVFSSGSVVEWAPDLVLVCLSWSVCLLGLFVFQHGGLVPVRPLRSGAEVLAVTQWLYAYSRATSDASQKNTVVTTHT